MVDTTTFRSFHRAPRTYLPSDPIVQPDKAPADVVLTDAAPAPFAPVPFAPVPFAPVPFAQELRARRKTVRSAWSLVKAEPQADSMLPVGADIVQAQPIEPSPDQQSSPVAEKPSLGLFEEALLHLPADLPRMTPSPEPTPAVDGAVRQDPLVEEFSHAAVSPIEERPETLVVASGEPTSTQIPHSVPSGPGADLPEDAQRHPAPGALSASADPWPVEAPPIDRHAGLAPIGPPLPLGEAIQQAIGESGLRFKMPAPATNTGSEPATILADADPGHSFTTGAMPSESGAPTVPAHFRSDPLHLDYQLLGLANPRVCTVIGRLGDASPIRMSVGRSGIYRPEGHRATPWNGLAYEVSPDGRTGLLSGTCILTARGEVAVEALVPGDAVLTLRGPALLPVAWIGRSIASAPPVQIEADAFGPGRPSRPLRIGADHLIFMQTDPVPAHTLVNGHSISTIASEAAELFHIDVGFAEVIFVEGIPVASGVRS